MPRTLSTFLDLIKFAHTIFAMPFALAAAFLALGTTGRWGALPVQLTLVVVCMVAARTVAMTVNRLVDRRFDRLNPRTATRPSVTGAVSPAFMAAAIILAGAVFVLGAAGFWWLYGNVWPVLLAVPVLLWLSAYSFTKRFTALCHFWLGVSLGMAPVSAWIALAPPAGPVVTPTVLLLGVAVTFWVAGFDILYALQDEAFDRETGLHSVPAAMGRARALWLSRLCHLLAVGALVGVGFTSPLLGAIYWTAVVIAAGLLVVEQMLVSPKDISRINLAFMTVNGVVGVVFGGLVVVDVLL